MPYIINSISFYLHCTDLFFESFMCISVRKGDVSPYKPAKTVYN